MNHGTPDWLDQLTTQHAAGQLPPGGFIWENPPQQLSNGGPRVARRTKATQHQTPWGGTPVAPMPAEIRWAVLRYLRRHPWRWARVHDGDLGTANVLRAWMINRSAAGMVDATIRNRGLTTALYARVINYDVLAEPQAQPEA